jgi:hypothetical protein
VTPGPRSTVVAAETTARQPVSLLGDETAPGGEQALADGSRWLVIQRSVSGLGEPTATADLITVTFHLVRAGSPADPRTGDPNQRRP